MGVNAEFSKLTDGRRSKTVTLRFGDVISRISISALKKVRKQVVYRLLIGRDETPGYFCLTSLIWSLKLCDLSNSNL